MIFQCNCPKVKNCKGHYTLQESSEFLTTYKFSRRDVKDDIVSVPTRKCVYCLEEGTVQVIRRDWYEYLWENPRKTVQEHFPYLSRAYREQIISGTHPVCFAEMFGDGE